MVGQKARGGLDLGERKTKSSRQNPYMVEWKELPPDIAEWDREFVRAIPAFLASVGLQVVRVPAT